MTDAQKFDAANVLLSPDQVEQLKPFGTQESIPAGGLVFDEADTNPDLIVVLDGRIEMFRVDPDNGGDVLLGVAESGSFIGELNVVTGQRAFAHARAVDESRLLRISGESLHELMARQPELGDLIFGALVARRDLIRGGDLASTLRIIGSRYSKQTLELVGYARRMQLAHSWIDPDDDDAVDGILAAVNLTPGDLPVVISPTAVLRRTGLAEFAAHVGLIYQPTSLHIHDVVIVGAGPAGLAAAVYGASEGLDTLVIDSANIGGQAGTSSRIENYVGFPTGISGGELAERAALQAQRLGARVSIPATCEGIEAVCDGYRLTLAGGTVLMTRTVLIAVGVQYRKLGLDRLEEFEGAGIYYAATDLEARVCGNGPVTVVGAGNSAGQAAIFLGQQGSYVTIVIRGDSLEKSMSSYLIDRIEAAPNIDVVTRTQVSALGGDDHLNAITVTNRDTDESQEQNCCGLFLFIGAVPFTDWLGDLVELDPRGFILTDTMLSGGVRAASALSFETSRPGIFAAGDARAGSMKRVAAAVGEGSSAIRSVHQHLSPTA